MDENKKSNILKKIVISVAISVIISVGICSLLKKSAFNNISLSNFKIESFNMETEKTTFTYSEDSISYDGSGKISCTDTKNDYLVLLEEINKTTNKTTYDYIIVHNGNGEFGTYDSSYLGAKEKPQYEFNIIGFQIFNK